MSIQLIHRYFAEVDRGILFGGKANEAVISQKKFGALIDGYCRKRHLLLSPSNRDQGLMVRPKRRQR